MVKQQKTARAKSPRANAAQPPYTYAAEMTPEQVAKAENRWVGNGDIAINRRITMTIMTRSKDQLLSACEDNSDVFLDIMQRVAQYIEMLEVGLKFARASEARLFIVGKEYADAVPPKRSRKAQPRAGK